MTVVYLILLLVAAICFAVAAFVRATLDGDGGRRSVNLVAAGLLAWVLVPLIQTIQALD